MDHPQIGDKIYIPSEFYLSHGADDWIGGLATVSKVEEGISGGQPTIYVTCKEKPQTRYNWKFLAEKQEELKVEFSEALAHASPDYRSEFNKWD